MNPDQPSREQIETRLTALLLGELPADEAALLRYTLARDPELQKLHDQLQATLALVREVAKTPAGAPVEKAEPLTLAAGRRQQLLAHFQTPRLRPEPLFWLKPIKLPHVSTLVATAFIIFFVLGVVAISLPNFVKARATSQSNAIINNLRQIDAAKQEWALEKHKSENDEPKPNDLTPYLRNGVLQPVAGETYALGKVSDPVVADTKEHEYRSDGQTCPPVISDGSAVTGPLSGSKREAKSSPANSLVLEAKKHYEMGEFAEAEKILRQAKTVNPNDPAATDYQNLIQRENEVAKTAHHPVTQSRMERVEKQWILPKMATAAPKHATASPSSVLSDEIVLPKTEPAPEVSALTPDKKAINAIPRNNHGAVVGTINAFAGTGSFRSAAGGHGGAGGNVSGASSISGLPQTQGQGYETAVSDISTGTVVQPAPASTPTAMPPPATLAFTGDNDEDKFATKPARPATPLLAETPAVGRLLQNRTPAGEPAPGGTALNEDGRNRDQNVTVFKVKTNGFYSGLPPTEQGKAMANSREGGNSDFNPSIRSNTADNLKRNGYTEYAPSSSVALAELQIETTNGNSETLGNMGGLEPTTPQSQNFVGSLRGDLHSPDSHVFYNNRTGKLYFKGTPEEQKAIETKLNNLPLVVNSVTASGTSPNPTMDAQQLQTINQQRVANQKIYTEQLVQLKELEAMQSTNKEALRDVLSQMVPDAALNDLIGKLNEANHDFVSKTNDYPLTSADMYRIQSSREQLNHEIDQRVDGIMASLKNQMDSKQAALDRQTAMVDEAKLKDQQQAVTNQSYYEAKLDLEKKRDMQKLLYAKLQQEQVDLNLPKTSMVQITDPAEPGQSRTAWQRLTGQVESKARIKVENDVTDIQGMGNTPTVATTGYDPYFIQTTFEIMQSELVLGKVVDALNLQTAWKDKNDGVKLSRNEAIKLLKQRIELQPVKNTKLVEISAKSNDPQESAKLANAVAKAYADYRFETRRKLSTNGVAILENKFQQETAEIKQAQENMDRLGKELNREQPTAIPAAKPVPDQTDLPLRKPAPDTPVPQPEILTRGNAFSTFSLNVSDVSFKLAAASLQNGRLPNTASIRSEEFINAFDYRDPEAAAGQPMAFTAERARDPFAHNRDLLRFSIKTAAAGRADGRALNLVLLLDTSGSMERADRVAIIREALRVLAAQLQPRDIVSVVTFARTARLWADGIPGSQAGETLDQVGGITPEGGTNLEEAMRLAYETARRHYLAGGLNRVVLLTDGAANLGNVDPSALKAKVEAQRQQGIALDCFGIGWEDLNDDLLADLSSHGDGRYAFLNSPEDTAREFAAKLAGALQVAAADVKVQVEFNPGRVISYRQIGYAKHQLTKEQFRDNTVAAGEIAAQEAGNALYTVEINPGGDGPVATVHVRYRLPGTQDYRERSWDVAYDGAAPALDQAGPAMRLAAASAAFAEWLAASPFAQTVTPDDLLKTLSGVPEIYGADNRPQQLETMIREAQSLEAK